VVELGCAYSADKRRFIAWRKEHRRGEVLRSPREPGLAAVPSQAYQGSGLRSRPLGGSFSVSPPGHIGGRRIARVRTTLDRHKVIVRGRPPAREQTWPARRKSRAETGPSGVGWTSAGISRCGKPGGAGIL
jgi:hypothetical protein